MTLLIIMGTVTDLISMVLLLIDRSLGQNHA